MSGFGQYDEGGSAKPMPAGIFEFEVVDADVRKVNGEPVRDRKSNKVRFFVTAKVVDGRHAGEIVKRTMNITYAPSQDGAYGPFAQFIEAVTGIPCGDARQKSVGKPELVGGRFRGYVKFERGYNNIVDFVLDNAPAAVVREPEPAIAIAPAARTSHPRPASVSDLDFALGLLPLPKHRQIRALAQLKGLDDASLMQQIMLVTGGERLTVDGVDELCDRLRALKAGAA